MARVGNFKKYKHTIMSSLQKNMLLKLLTISLLFSTACSAKNQGEDFILTGSTPGDDEIKNILHIPATTLVDFIRWEVQLNNNNSFVLNVQYGESQPNTLGFKKDGERKTLKGSFSISKSNRFNEIYHLKGVGLKDEISIVKLNNNIFHLLSSHEQLMIGNGGWSYSLNRKDAVKDNKMTISSLKEEDNILHRVYEGRTPCKEISSQHPEMNASPACFKIKWKLVLNRDSITKQPTTCTIRNIVDNQPRDIVGKWEILKGTANDPSVFIYKITVSNLTDPILFLAADNNILLFLDKEKEPLVGNDDFSFTMNKVNK